MFRRLLLNCWKHHFGRGSYILPISKVREYLRKWKRDADILEFETSSATVELAAETLSVEPARIAKTIAFKNGKETILVVTAGDTKIDNAKFKKEFGFKAKMLAPDEVLAATGFAVGGECPFGINNNIPVYLDISLKRFDAIFPACGSSNSAIQLTCSELEEYSYGKRWVDVCKNWL